MPTISEVRINNLLLLKDKYGSFTALRDAIGMSSSQFSQIKRYLENPAMKGTRGLGEQLSRRIEQTLSLPRGWLDAPQSLADFPPAAASAGNKTPAPAVATEGLSHLQLAVIDTATKLMRAKLIPDSECLKLLQTWQPLVEKLEAPSA
jgi:hypothetical protein